MRFVFTVSQFFQTMYIATPSPAIAVIMRPTGFVARNMRAVHNALMTTIPVVIAVHTADKTGSITSNAEPSHATATAHRMRFFVSSGCCSVHLRTACAMTSTFSFSSSIIGMIALATSLFTSSNALLSMICFQIAVWVASSAKPLYVPLSTFVIASAF